MGCLSGTLLMIEPVLALVLPIAVAVFWMAGDHEDGDHEDGDHSWADRFSWVMLGRIALMVGMTAAIVAPWAVRNWMVHGRPVPITSTFGHALWQGNPPIGPDTVSADDVLSGPTDSRASADPARYGRLCLRRLRSFLLFDPTDPNPASRLSRFAAVAWLVLAMIGLSMSVKQWRTLWPTYAIFTVMMLFHALVIVTPQSRVPVEPVTFLWAAMAVAPLVVRLMPGRRIRIYRPGEQSHDPFFDTEHVLSGPHYDLPPRRRAG